MLCINEDIYELEFSNNVMKINNDKTFYINSIYDASFINVLNNHNISIISIDSSDLNNDWLDLFKNTNFVISLKLINTKLTDEAFEKITKFKNLFSLSIINTKNVYGAGLYYISDSSIEYLDFTGTSIDKYGLIFLSRMRDLKVCLDNTKINYNELLRLSINNSIKVVTRGFFSENQLNNLMLKQINDCSYKKVLDIQKYQACKKRLLEFINFLTTLEKNLYVDYLDDSNFYIQDFLSEYVVGMFYKHNDFFISHKYDNFKFVNVEECEDESIRIYIQDFQKKHCFKRFVLNNEEKSKIIKIEEFDCGWKEISL